MATYALVQRFTIVIDDTDGAGPKDITIPTTIKLGSAYLNVSQRDTRCRTRVIPINRIFSVSDAFPITASLPGGASVDPACSHVTATFKDNRADPNHGVNVELATGGTLIRYNAVNLLVGEIMEVSTQIVEHKQPQGATVRIKDADTLEVDWDGTLIAGEKIVLSVDLFDIENLGDDVKEILFRQTRILAFHGENSIEDLIFYDDAGNPITYRIRTFNSKANADAAKLEIPDGDPLETGELTRVSVVQDFNVETNDRKSIKMTLTKGPAANPDIN